MEDLFFPMLGEDMLPNDKVSEVKYVLVEMYEDEEKEKERKEKKEKNDNENKEKDKNKKENKENKDCEEDFIRHVTRRVHGTIMQVSELRLGNTVGVYAELLYVTSYMPKIYKICGATLVGNIRHNFSSVEGSTWYHRLIDDHVNDNDTVYAYNRNKNTEKISQWHHMHVRLEDLFDEELNQLVGDEAILASMLDELSDNASTHATFWVYFRCIDETTRKIFLGMVKHYKKITTEWLKSEGMYAKQMQSVTKLDLSGIFELNVLVNRITTEVDWTQEKRNREEPDLAEFKYNEIYAACFELFSDAKKEGKKAFRYSFDEYWKQRIVIMPGGSVHSESYGDKLVSKSLPRKIRNKKGFFAATRCTTHNEWLEREPKIDSYTSTKYEWGKVRALYGCDVTSHLHSDFSLNKCEETFPSYIPTGSRANSDYVEAAAKNLRHMIPFCYDYDDFNSQHSFSSMKAVLAAWKQVYGADLSRQQIESLNWTISSVDKQTVHNSQTSDVYRTRGTLFSGWRLTTFMNTALNYAYLRVAGLKDCMAYSLHNGDDVYAAARNLGDVVRLIKNAEVHNVRAQATKMNIGTIAEFLRMDFNATNMTAKQYITRGCATFVHSRIESESPLVQRSVYKAIKTRGDEVISRGGNGSVIRNLMSKQYEFCSRLFGTKNFSEELEKLDIVAGGWENTNQTYNYALVDEIMVEDEDVDMSMLRPGMRDFVTHICEIMPVMRGKANIAQLEKTLRQSFNTKRSKLVSVESSKQEQNMLMSLRNIWANLPKLGKFAKARMTTADMLLALAGVSPAHASVIQRSHDPYKFVSIML